MCCLDVRKKGLILIEKKDDIDVDNIMMLAIDSGVEDVEDLEDSIEITTSVEQFEKVRNVLLKECIDIFSAEISFIPNTTITVPDAESEKLEKLLEVLEEHDDVQNVYTNYEPPETF